MDKIEKRVEKLEEAVTIHKEQNRLLWAYNSELTRELNKIKSSLDKGLFPDFCPDQKSLVRY